MASKSEDFAIELKDRVSGAAKAAKSASAELSERLIATREAATSLEAKLGEAAAKLAAMSQGAEGQASVSIGAVRRQQAAVAALQAQLDARKGDTSALEAAQGLAAEADAMSAAKASADALTQGLDELKAAQSAVGAAERIAATALANASALSAEDVEAEKAAAAYLKYDAAMKKFADDNAATVRAAMDKTQAGLDKNAASATQAAGGTDVFFNAVQGTAGPMGGMIGRARSLTSALGKGGGVAGAAAIGAAALVVFVVAIVAAAVALAKFALASADAARSQRLVTEGLAVTSASLADLGTILPKVQHETGLSADQIRGLAQQLDAAGVSAANMPEALNAIATATAGGASAEFIKKLNDGLKATGHVLPELQGQMAKLGDIAKDKARSIPALSERFHANIAGLFSGLKIDGFLKGLEKMVNLFDSSTASGKALKFLVEKLLQPLIDGATKAFPTLERGFLLGVAGALMLYIAVKKVQNALKDMGVEGAAAGGNAGLDLAKAASSIDSSQAGDTAALAKAAGKSMADGTAQGVLDGIPAVVAAVTQMGTTAVATLRTTLDSHSPSRKFVDVGHVGIAGGVTKGVETGTPEVNDAVAKMVNIPSRVKGDAKATRSSGGAKIVYIEANGRDRDDGFIAQLRAMLRAEFNVEALIVEPG